MSRFDRAAQRTVVSSISCLCPRVVPTKRSVIILEVSWDTTEGERHERQSNRETRTRSRERASYLNHPISINQEEQIKKEHDEFE